MTRLTILLLCAATPLSGIGFYRTADCQTPPATTTEPAADEVELTQRQRNLLLQLANAEANIQAINKALRQTGYNVGRAYDRISTVEKGSEGMDRNGGGPVRWDEFYGRTARDFYAPESWGTAHRAGGGKTVDIKAADNYRQLKRPSQFDFIYRANTDQIARANDQISSLRENQTALLERRRFHESEQSRLWATLAWERVKDLEISYQPVYRFRLQPPGADATILRPIVRFLRVANAASVSGLQTLKQDEPATFVKINQRVQESYAALQASLADALLSPEITPARRSQIDSLKALCKRLTEDCDVTVDNFNNAVESDKAKEDASKLKFREELQSSIAYFAAATAELDQQIRKMADSWKLTGETGVADPDAIAGEPKEVVAASTSPTSASPVPISVPAGLKAGLMAEYFSGGGLEDLKVKRVDTMLDFVWKKGEPPAPGCSTPKYSARWTGVLIVPASGATGIGVSADDGARLTVDGHRLFEFEKPQSRYVPGTLAPGPHQIEVSYHNRLAGGHCRLFWILTDKTDQEVTVPMNALYHAEAAGAK